MKQKLLVYSLIHFLFFYETKTYSKLLGIRTEQSIGLGIF